MKYFKLIVVLSILIGWNSLYSQVHGCYEIKKSMSGYGTLLYPEFLFQEICDLVKIVDTLDNNNIEFKVFSYDVYPILAYIDPEDGIDYQISEIKKELVAYSEYSTIIKAFVGKNVRYTFLLKLPTSGLFSNISSMQSEAIQVNVEQAMNVANIIIPDNMNIEIHGFSILNDYLNQIKNGTLNIDVFSALGFQQIVFNQSESYLSSNSIEISGNIRDYSGIKNSQNKFLRSSLIEGSNSLPYNKSMIYILTSDSMSNYNNSIANAKFDFENLEKDFVVWLHFKNDADSTRTLMTVKTNISKSEAANIIDQEFNNSMSYINESIEWYESEFQFEDIEFDDLEAIEFDEGEIEDDTIVTLINNKGSDNKEDRLIENKKVIQDREVHHPYNCASIQCFSLKWRAYCCFLTDLERNNISTDYALLYQKAISCGVLDGVVETCDFIYMIFNLNRDLNPYLVPVDLSYLILKYGAAKGIEMKIDRYISLYGNASGLIQSMMSQQTWILLTDMIKQSVDEIVFNEGLTIQGYRVGNIVFAILLDFATTGGAEVKTLAQISKVGAEKLMQLTKNPQAFASAIKSATTKYVNNSIKKLKKLKFATAGRLNIQRAIRTKFLNGNINLGTVGSYIYNKRTGNIGEILVDVNLQENGYQVLTKPILHIDDNIHKGLDIVAKKNGQYYVFESKYNTAKQKVFGGNLQGSYDYAEAENRLLKACGKQVYDDIVNKGFTNILAKVNPNGNITYHVLDNFGKRTGTYWTP